MDISELISAAQERCGATARSCRYAARLDDHLATLAAETRAGFLDRETAKWCENYREWAHRVDSNTASKRELTYTAFDFTLTLAEIAKRRAQYPQVRQ